MLSLLLSSTLPGFSLSPGAAGVGVTAAGDTQLDTVLLQSERHTCPPSKSLQ